MPLHVTTRSIATASAADEQRMHGERSQPLPGPRTGVVIADFPALTY
jgi:hypothetical protein